LLRVIFVAAFAAATAGCASQPSVGTVDFTISCSRSAQVEFNRAVALLHHMTYPQARESFQRVTEIEPGCAMAHWGIAMTLFQPLWPTRPTPQELLQGWDEVQKAEEQASTPREQLFVAAAAAFFAEPTARDYWARIRSWETAMEQLYARFPDDPEAATFYALAHLAASTPATARAHADRAAEILATVRGRNPDHPGAMHYLIHANDVPGREHDSLEVTHTYSEIAPRNPHALHMPTHIYTRLGEWDGVISGNLQAAEAALEHPAGEHGELVWDEFPHAIEYLVYAYLQKGMNDEAALQLRRLLTTENLEPTFKTAFHLASTQARYALERRAWSEAAALAPREPATLDWNRFAWPEAITHFARGLGAVHLNDAQLAQVSAERLAALEVSTRTAGEELFANNIQMLRLELSAWIAHVQGHHQAGIDLMRQAAALESSTPKHAVTPGPTLPAEELLGDMLMEQGRAAEALAAYQRALSLYPNRCNSLLGVARAEQKELLK
jgi:tetratricopeptide (TPR) repeat protein